jgi:hypothetical protein
MWYVYIDDEGELHLTMSPRKYDGKAYFFGYANLHFVDLRGDEVSIKELDARYDLALQSQRRR